MIVGTDTDAGKTVAAGLLAAALRKISANVGYYKPIQTGCEYIDGELQAPDVETVRNIVKSSLNCDINAQAGYLFKKPCSPHLAADIENTEIDIRTLAEKTLKFADENEFTLAEGAGGVFVPLTSEATTIDYLRLLNWPVIIVSPNRLGTVNHTLMTIETLQNRGIKIEGIAVTHLAPATDSEIRYSNMETIRKFTGLENIASLPYLPDENYQPGINAWLGWLRRKGIA